MEGEIATRATGVLVSIAAGRAVAYSLDTLQQRAELHVAPGDVVYEGMVVGENSRSGDMPVNPTKEKKLSNMRAAGHDRNILLKPPRRLTLEEALEFIEEDELVEVTPTQIRLRKTILKEVDRKRAGRRGRRNREGGRGKAEVIDAVLFVRPSDFGLPTSTFRLRPSDFGLPTSAFRLRPSDFRLPLRPSDFRLFLNSAFRLPPFP